MPCRVWNSNSGGRLPRATRNTGKSICDRFQDVELVCQRRWASNVSIGEDFSTFRISCGFRGPRLRKVWTSPCIVRSRGVGTVLQLQQFINNMYVYNHDTSRSIAFLHGARIPVRYCRRSDSISRFREQKNNRAAFDRSLSIAVRLSLAARQTLGIA